MNFSDIYNSFNIKPEASVEYTMKLFKKSINAYLNYHFMNYKKPSFFVSGVVTTTAGVSTPLVGNLASLSTFQISTIDENYILNNLSKFGFINGFFKTMTDIINKSLFIVDIKFSGFLFQQNVKLNLTPSPMSEIFEKELNTKKPDNYQIFWQFVDQKINEFFKLSTPITIPYSSPGIATVFNGTISVKL